MISIHITFPISYDFKESLLAGSEPGAQHNTGEENLLFLSLLWLSSDVHGDLKYSVF